MSGTGNISAEARLFMFICGLLFLLWTISELRQRKLLVTIASLFVLTGLGFIWFALVPNLFDSVAFAIGIKYPPLLYLILGYFVLLALIGNLAARLSMVDERCRRLTEELAIMDTMKSALENQLTKQLPHEDKSSLGAKRSNQILDVEQITGLETRDVKPFG